MSGLDDAAKALLAEAFPGWVTMLRPDGSLHSTVVWVDVDGEDVIFNTAVGRAKERNLRADPRVSVSMVDPNDAFRAVSISREARLEEEGAEDVIDRLAHKYLGVDRYPLSQAAQRKLERVFGRQEYRRAFPGEIAELSYPSRVVETYVRDLQRP